MKVHALHSHSHDLDIIFHSMCSRCWFDVVFCCCCCCSAAAAAGIVILIFALFGCLLPFKIRGLFWRGPLAARRPVMRWVNSNYMHLLVSRNVLERRNQHQQQRRTTMTMDHEPRSVVLVLLRVPPLDPCINARPPSHSKVFERAF